MKKWSKNAKYALSLLNFIAYTNNCRNVVENIKQLKATGIIQKETIRETSKLIDEQ